MSWKKVDLETQAKNFEKIQPIFYFCGYVAIKEPKKYCQIKKKKTLTTSSNKIGVKVFFTPN